jgi:hypothetical protein
MYTLNRLSRSTLFKSAATLLLAVLVAVMPAFMTLAQDASSEASAYRGPGLQTTPRGYSKYIVYAATGVIDPKNPSPRPGVTGCDGTLFCDGDYFHREIMKRSDAEFAALQSQAKAFFLERFGLNADDPASMGKIRFRDFTVNPSFGYRTYSFSGLPVPSSGYEVRDGGWLTEVIDPAGIKLGGEFEGITVPVGTIVVFGDYNIAVTNRSGDVDKEIIISYRSGIPIVPQQDGSFLFRCELKFDKDFSDGLAMGQVANVLLPDGRIKSNGVNRLTSPPLSTFDGF